MGETLMIPRRPLAAAVLALTFAAEDLPLAKAVNAYWAAFIKSGDPDSAGGPAWRRFTPATEASMEFGAAGPVAREHHLKAQLDWQEEAVKAGASASPTAPRSSQTR
jgi:carboxylesterase type B